MGHRNPAGVSQPQGANAVVVALQHGNYRLRSLDLVAQTQYCARQAHTGSQALFDQVRDNFGIGFRPEHMPTLDKVGFQRQVVFNDAIVRHRDAAGAIGMGMSIGFRWTSVGSPTRVSESGKAGGVGEV